ncbi:MAG: helix-turn-helix transcriptional regulator [Arenicella sp.]|nr:helix-turn-helix transcriptional regulator [Arenicella sp.]
MSDFSKSGITEDFQIELFGLVQRLLPVDAIRFNIYVPHIDLNQDAGFGSNVDQMTERYARKFWQFDPMHPTNFEDKDTLVVTNSMLMTDFAWQKTRIFQEFFKPGGYFHDADVFFRQEGRIIAVLTLLRNDPLQFFTERETQLLIKIQPFIQYSLSNVYLPKRVHDRTSLSATYDLTVRELDVVELALTGASNKILSKQLKISMPTLRTHMQNIYTKVGVHSNSELISKLMTMLK